MSDGWKVTAERNGEPSGWTRGDFEIVRSAGGDSYTLRHMGKLIFIYASLEVAMASALSNEQLWDELSNMPLISRAYGDCHCSCHRISGIIHAFPCCSPSDDEAARAEKGGEP